MDLFHAVTQSIENVLTCHWYDGFNAYNNNSMSSDSQDKRMETEAGGEQTQYESAVTENVGTAKQGGQMGAGLEKTESVTSAVKEKHDQSTAENIRYGQNISESGMGGMTNSSGSASEGGYGGAARDASTENSGDRAAQGYGSGNNVGG